MLLRRYGVHVQLNMLVLTLCVCDVVKVAVLGQYPLIASYTHFIFSYYQTCNHSPQQMGSHQNTALCYYHHQGQSFEHRCIARQITGPFLLNNFRSQI